MKKRERFLTHEEAQELKEFIDNVRGAMRLEPLYGRQRGRRMPGSLTELSGIDGFTHADNATALPGGNAWRKARL